MKWKEDRYRGHDARYVENQWKWTKDWFSQRRTSSSAPFTGLFLHFQKLVDMDAAACLETDWATGECVGTSLAHQARSLQEKAPTRCARQPNERATLREWALILRDYIIQEVQVAPQCKWRACSSDGRWIRDCFAIRMLLVPSWAENDTPGMDWLIFHIGHTGPIPCAASLTDRWVNQPPVPWLIDWGVFTWGPFFTFGNWMTLMLLRPRNGLDDTRMSLHYEGLHHWGERLRAERHFASVSPPFAFHLVPWMLSLPFVVCFRGWACCAVLSIQGLLHNHCMSLFNSPRD